MEIKLFAISALFYLIKTVLTYRARNLMILFGVYFLMSESRHSQYFKNTPTVSWKGTPLHFQTYPLSIWRACEVSRRFCPLSPVVGRPFRAHHATRDNAMK